MTPQETELAMKRALQHAADKRSADAMKGLALIVGVPLALLLLFSLFGG